MTGRILVTGAAGFIGAHVSARLMARGDEVTGIDNLNSYYDVRLKQARLDNIPAMAGGDPAGSFQFRKLDLTDQNGLASLFAEGGFDKVIHLAAQAGVRHSIDHPQEYAASNLNGFLNILENCRHAKVRHLVYASSSSVYGANQRMPFSEHDNVDHPLSFYAATKKANELMAHSYAALHGLACTGLRFFTVYGPWGRPDMAFIIFVRAILKGEPIDVFNYGRHRRDFTYIDDIVEGVVRVLDRDAEPDPDWDGQHPDPATSKVPWRIYNIGNSRPVELGDCIEIIEKALGREAIKNHLPMRRGEMPHTFADVEALAHHAGYQPSTSLETGIARFVKWYLEYYGEPGGGKSSA
jgi:UDP-glucuronate 4-epimerase